MEGVVVVVAYKLPVFEALKQMHLTHMKNKMDEYGDGFSVLTFRLPETRMILFISHPIIHSIISTSIT